ncbi:MAG: hypothetical protein IKX63_02255, partial [Muribaculaceae bacterium]|nr:hypothetical protein [Muribaculaceae bacterium]
FSNVQSKGPETKQDKVKIMRNEVTAFMKADYASCFLLAFSFLLFTYSLLLLTYYFNPDVNFN